jgi:hypothetical protein
MTATALAVMIASKETSPLEAVDTAIARAEAAQPWADRRPPLTF